MFVYCCPKCKLPDIGEKSDEIYCMRCHTLMVSSGIPTSEWNEYDSDQKNAVIDRCVGLYRQNKVEGVKPDAYSRESPETEPSVRYENVDRDDREENIDAGIRSVKNPDYGRSLDNAPTVQRKKVIVPDHFVSAQQHGVVHTESRRGLRIVIGVSAGLIILSAGIILWSVLSNRNPSSVAAAERYSGTADEEYFDDTSLEDDAEATGEWEEEEYSFDPEDASEYDELDGSLRDHEGTNTNDAEGRATNKNNSSSARIDIVTGLPGGGNTSDITSGNGSNGSGPTTGGGSNNSSATTSGGSYTPYSPPGTRSSGTYSSSASRKHYNDDEEDDEKDYDDEEDEEDDEDDEDFEEDDDLEFEDDEFEEDYDYEDDEDFEDDDLEFEDDEFEEDYDYEDDDLDYVDDDLDDIDYVDDEELYDSQYEEND